MITIFYNWCVVAARTSLPYTHDVGANAARSVVQIDLNA